MEPVLKMIILGISSFYHDSAACLLKNDNILTAVQEERFSRIKHDQNFPIQSILYCLNSNNLTPEKIDFVVLPKQDVHLQLESPLVEVLLNEEEYIIKSKVVY